MPEQSDRACPECGEPMMREAIERGTWQGPRIRRENYECPNGHKFTGHQLREGRARCATCGTVLIETTARQAMLDGYVSEAPNLICPEGHLDTK